MGALIESVEALAFSTNMPKPLSPLIVSVGVIVMPLLPLRLTAMLRAISLAIQMPLMMLEA